MVTVNREIKIHHYSGESYHNSETGKLYLTLEILIVCITIIVCAKIYNDNQLNYSVCLENHNSYITIIPCYSNRAALDISKVTHITRKYLDKLGVSRDPKLKIEIPVNIQFDDIFSEVHFTRSAAQYYFPEIRDVSYIVYENPTYMIKHFHQKQFYNMICDTVYCDNNLKCIDYSPHYGNACLIKN